MPAEPILASAVNLDLSSRIIVTNTLVGSPADATETIIASLTLPRGIALATGVILAGNFGVTVGTNGTSIKARIRQTSVGGSAIATGPTIPDAAGVVDGTTLLGFDSAPAEGQVYKLTLTVAAATAVSTVSVVSFIALAV